MIYKTSIPIAVAQRSIFQPKRRVLVAVLMLLLLLNFDSWGQDFEEMQKIISADRAANDRFGFSVAVDGNYAVIGAYDEDENVAGTTSVSGAGSAYIFKRGTNGTWSQLKKITANDRGVNDRFGYSVAISGDYIVVGAYQEDQDANGANTLSDAGSVYVFKRNTGGTDNWGQVKKLVANDRATFDYFGYSVAIDGSFIVVGAYQEDQDANNANTLANSGSAYIFEQDEGGTDNWGQVKKIVANDRANNNSFGTSVAIHNNRVIVGSPLTHISGVITNAGTAYIFEQHQGGLDNWGLVTRLVSNDIASDDRFGISVAIYDDVAVVGAYYEDQDTANANTLTSSGSVYVFYQNKGGINNWGQQKKIVASDRTANDWFGYSVAIEEDYIVVSPYLEDEDENGLNTLNAAGSIYVFYKNQDGNDEWGQYQKLVSKDRASFDYFGTAIDISNGFIVTGASLEDEDANGGNSLSGAGSAYIFYQPPPRKFYVNKLSNGLNNGSSWTDAFTDLQRALSEAKHRDTIWVAKGIYRPIQDIQENTNPSDLRTKTFHIHQNIVLYGGFQGTETMLSQRNYHYYPTILSGDLDNNDTDSDTNGIIVNHTDITGNNTYHVLFLDSLANSAVLDGFIVTAGNADHPAILREQRGGGIYLNAENTTCAPLIYHCQVIGNNASQSGGGIYINGEGGSANTVIANSIFFANNQHIGYDDAIANQHPKFINCNFVKSNNPVVNITNWNTGQTNMEFLNCIFWLNLSAKNVTGNINIQYSLIDDNFYAGVNNNVNQDPLFLSVTLPDLRIKVGSPAINTGLSNSLASVLDLAAKPRVISTSIDKGAYEGGVYFNFTYFIPSQIIYPDSCKGGNGGVVLHDDNNPNLAYTWSTGANTKDLLNLSAGSYSVTVTDGIYIHDTTFVILKQADATPPTFLTQNTSIPLDANGNATLFINQVDNGTFDDCGGVVTLTLSQSAFSCSEIGNNAIYLIATDTSNNTDSTLVSVSVIDTTSPSIITKPVSIYLDAIGAATLTPADVNNGSNDNCGTPTFSLSKTTFNCSNLGINNIVFTATDQSGNNSYGNALVTVFDTISPKIIAKNDTIYLNASGTATLTPADINNGSTDNCGTLTFSLSKTTFNCTNLGNNNVVFTATDPSGNSAAKTITIIVLDSIKPVISIKNPMVYLNASGIATLTPTDINNGSIDNCGTPTFSLSKTTFNCANLGNNNVVFTATDATGNTNSKNSVVTVVDTISPNAIAKNFAIYLDASGIATLTPTDVNNGSIDNCGTPTFSLSETTFNCSHLGSNNVVFTATDANGKSSSKTVVVTVLDTITPTVFTKNATIYLNASGTAILTPANVNNGSTDNCGTPTFSLSKTTFNCTNLGINNVVFAATDVSGKTNSKTVTVTVLDTVAPTVFTKNATIYLNASGTANLVPADVNNGSIGNCGTPTFSLSKTTFDCTNLGINNVVFTATDANGKSNSKTVTITVLDTIAPTVFTKNTTIYLNTSGTTTLTPADVNSGSTDNCGTPTLSLSKTTFNCSNLGANNVVFTATDANGKSNSKTVTVTVFDTISPNAIVKNATIYLNASGTTTLTPADVNNGSFDNCGTSTFSLSKTTFNCTNLGDNNIVFTATDANGKSNSKTVTITVLDTIAPTVFTKNATVYLNASGTATLTPTDVNNGSTDNCGTPTFSLSKTTFDCTNLGINNVVFTATDANGKSNSKTVTITVLDTIVPTIFAKNVTIYLGANGTATLTSADVNNGSSDNCGTPTFSLSKTTFNCSDLGANNVVFTAMDANGKNTAKTVTVTVLDTISPTVSAKNATIYLDANGTAILTPADVNNGSTDNCGTPAFFISKATFNCSNLGSNNVVFTASDASGKSNSKTVTITVLDTIAPTVFAKNATVYLNASGTATLTPADVNNGSTDNCGTPTFSLSKTTFNCSNLGANNVVFTATDANGKSNSKTVVVTVLDTIAPTVFAKNATVYLNASGTATLTPADVNNGSTDNCGTPTFSLSKTTFNCSNLGANNIVFTATDANGKSNSKTVIVTVLDTIAPTVFAKNATVYLNASGTATLTPADVNNGSTDNCGTPTFSLSKTTFNCLETGNNNVILTATDGSGNTHFKGATVVILDTISPQAFAKNITVLLDATGTINITASQVDNGSVDNCGIPTISLSKTIFDCSNLGANTVILTATDAGGKTNFTTAVVTVNAPVGNKNPCDTLDFHEAITSIGVIPETCGSDNGSIQLTSKLSGLTFLWSTGATTQSIANLAAGTYSVTVTLGIGKADTTITVPFQNDVTPPTVKVKNISISLDANGFAVITPSQIDNGSVDNCAIAGISAAPLNFNCSSIGTNKVKFTVIDVNGNIATDTALVTVLDDAPIIAKGFNIAITLNETGEATLTAAQVNNGSSDNCLVTLSLSQSNFTCDDLGENEILLIVTNTHGETAIDTIVVTVEDADEPVLICHDISLETSPNSQLVITPEEIISVADDNCGIASFILNRTTFNINDIGEQLLNLTVADANGNVATCVAKLTLSAFCLDLPQVFTPNGDGKNDTWKLNCLSEYPHDVKIYSRWGQLVFQSNNYQGWDGRALNGELVQDGGYNYIITLTSKGIEQRITGAVTVVR